MYLCMVWGNWIAIREDKAERNEDGPKSDENVTLPPSQGRRPRRLAKYSVTRLLSRFLLAVPSRK